jgi:hypothetical protein
MKLTSVECILCENAFGRYCVPKSSRHRPASQEVLGGRVWERETIEFMRRHVLDRDVIHAGMFFGDFLPGLAPALAPGRKVFAFEPNPESFACAQWTAALNALTNVDMRNAGLGEAKRSALMRTQENGRAIGGASHILLTGSPSRTSFTLGYRERCNFCKRCHDRRNFATGRRCWNHSIGHRRLREIRFARVR